MKLTFIRYLLALCLAFAGSAFGQPISWKLLPGAGNDIGVGANGAVWVIGTNKSGNDFGIWRWNAGAANWDQMPGGALRIDVDPQGVAWVVNSNHAIYRWGGSAWQMMPGLANDVGIGANGAVWVIGTNPTGGGYGIYRWNAAKNNWDQMPGGGVRIDVDPQGNAWIVNSEGSIYRWTGTTWQKMPGAAKDIGIGANGAVWVVGTDSGVYQWIGIEWIKREGALTDISVDAKGLPWGVNSNKAIYTALRRRIHASSSAPASRRHRSEVLSRHGRGAADRAIPGRGQQGFLRGHARRRQPVRLQGLGAHGLDRQPVVQHGDGPRRRVLRHAAG